MSSSKNEKPFAEKSVKDKCDVIVHGAPWQINARDGELSNTRQVTWMRYPYRYMLTEYAREEQNMLRRKKLVSKLFKIAMLSARKTDTDLHEYRQYYVPTESDRIYLLQNEVDSPEKEQQTGNMAAGQRFILDNDLYVPNGEDLLILDHALSLAYEDGVEPCD